jgi:hypothetical protein
VSVEHKFEERSIKLCVFHINPELQITCWPDKKQNRTTPEVDAVAMLNEHLFAIEHTTIDSYKDQRKNDANFRKIVGVIEEEFKDLSFRLELQFANWTYREKNYGVIQAKIKEWITQNAEALPLNVRTEVSLSNTNASFFVIKRSCFQNGVVFGRIEPSNKPANFGHLQAKLKKLRNWKQNKSATTVLLVETQDSALIEPVIAAENLTAHFNSELSELPDRVIFIQWTSEDAAELTEISNAIVSGLPEYLNTKILNWSVTNLMMPMHKSAY